MSDTKPKASVLDDINNDEFVPKQFVSSAKNKEAKIKNIVIDVNAKNIQAPQIADASSSSDNSIFHTSVSKKLIIYTLLNFINQYTNQSGNLLIHFIDNGWQRGQVRQVGEEVIFDKTESL